MLPAVDIIIIIIIFATTNITIIIIIIIITFCKQEFQQDITCDAYMRTSCSYKQHLSFRHKFPDTDKIKAKFSA